MTSASAFDGAAIAALSAVLSADTYDKRNGVRQRRRRNGGAMKESVQAS
jgi:hypothetical protein